MSNSLTIQIWLLLFFIGLYVLGGLLVYVTSHGRTMRRMEKLNKDFLNIPRYKPSEYSINKNRP